jgi:hypothetical protein
MKLSDWVITWYSNRRNPVGSYDTIEELRAKDKILEILQAAESRLDKPLGG